MAYKFLAAGAVAPFTGFRWPVPGPHGAGAWVEAPDERLEHGIHACRVRDLAFWLDAELWRAELAEPIVEGQRQIVARRGRLLERITLWNGQMARSFAEACAWRARDRSVAALREAALAEEAQLLARCSGLPELRSASSRLSARTSLPGVLAGYLMEAVDCLLAGDSACSTYISARSAVATERSGESAFGTERELQASLLADRVGL